MPYEFQNYTPEEIIEFFVPSEGLPDQRRTALTDAEFKSLTRRIESLAQQLNLHQVGIILNGLAEIGHDRYFLKGSLPNINDFLWVWDLEQNLRNSNPEIIADIAKLFEGLAKLSYDKGELSINTVTVSEWIFQEINNFSARMALGLLHSFAKLGYDSSDEPFINSVKRLAEKAKSGVEKFGVKDIASLTHSSAKAGLFGVIFDVKEIIGTSRAVIDYKTATAFLQANLFRECFHGRPFLDAETIEWLEERRQGAPANIISESQWAVGQALERMGFSVQHEYPADKVRDFDIFARRGRMRVIVEVNGSTHYLRHGKTALNTESRKTILINRWLIEQRVAQIEGEGNHYYHITIPSRLAKSDQIESIIDAALNKADARINIASAEEKKEELVLQPVVSPHAQEQTIEQVWSRSPCAQAEATGNEEKRDEETEANETSEAENQNKNKEKANSGGAKLSQTFDFILNRPPEEQPGLFLRLLKDAIKFKNVEIVKSILARGAFDLNLEHVPGESVEDAGLSFLNYALDRLIGANHQKNIDPLLRIIDALVAAGAEDNNPSKLSDPRAEGFFNRAVEKLKAYNAASFIVSKFVIGEGWDAQLKIDQVPQTSSVPLIANVVSNLPGLITTKIKNAFWRAAVFKNNFEEIGEVLVDAGIFPTDDDICFAVLLKVIGKGNENIVRAFVSYKPALATRSQSHISLLRCAIVYGDEKAFDILVAAGASIRDVEERDSGSISRVLVSLLLTTFMCSRIEMVKRILDEIKKDKDSRDLLRRVLFGEDAVNGVIAIHSAVLLGDVRIVERLCRIATEENMKDYVNASKMSDKFTSLHLAIIKLEGETLKKMVSTLISFGANIQAIENGKLNPLQLATIQGQVEIVRILCQAAVNKEIGGYSNIFSYGRSPLHCAVSARNRLMVQTLISVGANVNAVISEQNNTSSSNKVTGLTVLHVAAQIGDLPIVSELVYAGANVNAVATINSIQGVTPFTLAWQASNRPVSYFLLTRGAQQDIEPVSVERPRELGPELPPGRVFTPSSCSPLAGYEQEKSGTGRS